MSRLNIQTIILQNKGRPNICSSCGKTIKFDTIKQKWIHLKSTNCAGRKPSFVNKKPVFFKIHLKSQSANAIKISAQIHVKPIYFNNRGNNKIYPIITNNEADTRALNNLREVLVKAGEEVEKFGDNATNKLWEQKFNELIASNSNKKAMVGGIAAREAFAKAIESNQDYTSGTKTQYTNTAKTFFEFLDGKGISVTTFPVALISKQHINDFEKWQLLQPERFTSLQAIKNRAHHVATVLREVSKSTEVHPTILQKIPSVVPRKEHDIIVKIDTTSTTRPFTREEFMKIINYVPGENLVTKRPDMKDWMIFNRTISHKLLLFQLLTGLSGSDMCTFDVDGHIINRGEMISKLRWKKRKNAKPTYAEIVVFNKTREIIEWFKQAKSHPYYPEGDFMFFPLTTIKKDGSNSNIGSHNLDQKYKVLKEELGLPALTSHMARRTSATILFHGGVSVDIIKKHLGDNTTSIVEQSYIGRAEYDFKDVYKDWMLEEDAVAKAKQALAGLSPEEAIAALTPEQRKLLRMPFE